MQDQKIAQTLNQAFKKSATHFCTFSGRNNHLKLAYGSDVAYCYLDAYQSNRRVELQLVTLRISKENVHKVHKNEVICEPPFRVDYNDLETIDVSFRSNPEDNKLNLVQITFELRSGVKKSKVFRFAFDEDTIDSGESVCFEQCSTNKPPILALWHPFYSQYALIMTEDSFEWILYKNEEQYEKIISQKISKFNFGESIVDFRFWPQEQGIRKFIIIATGQNGNIYFLLCKIGCNIFEENLSSKEIEILDKIPGFEMKRYCDLPSGYKSCQGLQVECPSGSDFVLMSRVVSNIGRNGRTVSIAITALIEENTQINERSIIGLKGQPDQFAFEIPHRCLFNGKFHFWCEDRLNIINLTTHINYLNSLQRSQLTSKFPTKEIQANTLFAAPQQTVKFVSIEKNSIKLLRRHETEHSYKFANIPVENISLELQKKKVSQKLSEIFDGLKETLEELTTIKKDEPLRKIQTELKALTEEGDEKEVQMVKNTVEKYIKQNLEGLKSEKSEVERLYEEAINLSGQFQRQKGNWREMQSILNRIQKNDKVIQDLEQQSKNEDYEGTMSTLQEMHDFIKKRTPLQIDPKARDQNRKWFSIELSNLKSIKQSMQEVEDCLQRLEDIE